MQIFWRCEEHKISLSKSSSMDPKMLISSFRNKVDLTKYIEEHNFNFDNVFDENADNNVVSLSQF